MAQEITYVGNSDTHTITISEHKRVEIKRNDGVVLYNGKEFLNGVSNIYISPSAVIDEDFKLSNYMLHIQASAEYKHATETPITPSSYTHGVYFESNYYKLPIQASAEYKYDDGLGKKYDPSKYTITAK